MANLITYKDVAKRLGVAVGTVHSWVSTGRIPHVKFGKRCVRFDAEVIEAWVDGFRRPAAQKGAGGDPTGAGDCTGAFGGGNE